MNVITQQLRTFPVSRILGNVASCSPLLVSRFNVRPELQQAKDHLCLALLHNETHRLTD